MYPHWMQTRWYLFFSPYLIFLGFWIRMLWNELVEIRNFTKFKLMPLYEHLIFISLFCCIAFLRILLSSLPRLSFSLFLLLLLPPHFDSLSLYSNYHIPGAGLFSCSYFLFPTEWFRSAKVFSWNRGYEQQERHPLDTRNMLLIC